MQILPNTNSIIITQDRLKQDIIDNLINAGFDARLAVYQVRDSTRHDEQSKIFDEKFNSAIENNLNFIQLSDESMSRLKFIIIKYMYDKALFDYNPESDNGREFLFKINYRGELRKVIEKSFEADPKKLRTAGVLSLFLFVAAVLKVFGLLTFVTMPTPIILIVAIVGVIGFISEMRKKQNNNSILTHAAVELAKERRNGPVLIDFDL